MPQSHRNLLRLDRPGEGSSSEKRRELLREVTDLHGRPCRTTPATQTEQFGDILGTVAREMEMRSARRWRPAR